MNRKRPTLRPDGYVRDQRTIEVDGQRVTYRSYRSPAMDVRTQGAIDRLMAAAYRQFAGDGGSEEA